MYLFFQILNLLLLIFCMEIRSMWPFFIMHNFIFICVFIKIYHLYLSYFFVVIQFNRHSFQFNSHHFAFTYFKSICSIWICCNSIKCLQSLAQIYLAQFYLLLLYTHNDDHFYILIVIALLSYY